MGRVGRGPVSACGPARKDTELGPCFCTSWECVVPVARDCRSCRRSRPRREAAGSCMPGASSNVAPRAPSAPSSTRGTPSPASSATRRSRRTEEPIEEGWAGRTQEQAHARSKLMSRRAQGPNCGVARRTRQRDVFRQGTSQRGQQAAGGKRSASRRFTPLRLLFAQFAHQCFFPEGQSARWWGAAVVEGAHPPLHSLCWSSWVRLGPRMGR